MSVRLQQPQEQRHPVLLLPYLTPSSLKALYCSRSCCSTIVSESDFEVAGSSLLLSWTEIVKHQELLSGLAFYKTDIIVITVSQGLRRGVGVLFQVFTCCALMGLSGKLWKQRLLNFDCQLPRHLATRSNPECLRVNKRGRDVMGVGWGSSKRDSLGDGLIVFNVMVAIEECTKAKAGLSARSSLETVQGQEGLVLTVTKDICSSMKVVFCQRFQHSSMLL